MKRFVHIGVLAVGFFVVVAIYIPQQVLAATVSGVVSSVSSCYTPGGYAFTVGTSSTLYIYRTGATVLYPQNAKPQLGVGIFAVSASETVSCDTDSSPAISLVEGKLLSYFSSNGATSTPPTPPPPPRPPTSGGSGSGNSGSNPFSQIQNMLKDLFKPPAQQGGGGQVQGLGGPVTPPGTTGSIGSSSSGLVSPTNFGGPVLTPIPCDPSQSVPTGTIWMIPIGPPRGGNFMYNPLLARSYQCGPPLIPGQNTLGSYTITGMCDTCIGPEAVCPVPGLGFLNAMPGHGTSGCVLSNTPKSSSSQKPVDGCGGAITKDNKAASEAALRGKLKAIGISVNHPENPGGCGYMVNGVKAACTDITGLQCKSISELQNLAQCSSFTLTGGSELGHSNQHTSGNAVDIAHSTSLDKCIKDKFTPIDCPPSLPGKKGSCWLNAETKSVYWAEPTVGNQPGHWHVCMNGFCYR